tara:strand:- start:132 stop:371 length:240 start_codon:yes stop_codon:yes gene_type:complete
MVVEAVALQHLHILVVMLVLEVEVVDFQMELVELLIQHLAVVLLLILNQLREVTDFLDLVVAVAAEVTPHLMEEMVDLV